MSYARYNLVPQGAPGFAIAIQYWPGDEARALRLARLLAAIEPGPRKDMVTVVLCRRSDMPELSVEAAQVRAELGARFGSMAIRSERPGVGHPAGANALWSGSFEKLAEFWAEGKIQASWVMFVEADGCPLSADWIGRVRAEIRMAETAGKRVIGAVMRDPLHVNGSLVAHMSLWHDHPSLHRTPPEQAWDVFHRAVLWQEAWSSHTILNAYGSSDWTPDALRGMGMQGAWLSSTKDDSAIRWAEENLTRREDGA